jgi:SAM-dependent methyltransferase
VRRCAVNAQTEEEISGDAVDWIVANLELRPTNAAEFWYDRMESQSGWGLPIVHQPFDGRVDGHFVARGAILDYAIVAGPGRVLDFGPGDGWPSLLIAPLVDEVVGVDGSRRRVEVCRENADRLGIGNTHFVHVPPGQSLPFDDASFAGVTAASSIEQTPDPTATLKELHRILRPGGRLRMGYESLGYYADGREREIAVGDPGEYPMRILIFDRHIEEEYVQHYGLLLDLERAEVEELLSAGGRKPSYAGLTPAVLRGLSGHLADAVTYTTQHPSCRTLLRWLGEVGFQAARPTHDGGWFARRLFQRLPEACRSREMGDVDRLLRPLVEVVVTMEAPNRAIRNGWEPMITALK